jgi:hypothetical protein
MLLKYHKKYRNILYSEGKSKKKRRKFQYIKDLFHVETGRKKIYYAHYIIHYVRTV